MRYTSVDTKKKIIITAANLFNQKGIHQVGINEIITKSNIAKMTLYKYFSSKDQLILEVIQYQDEQWRQWFRESMDKRSGRPREKLLAIFDVIEDWFNSTDFRRCPFSTIAAQIADLNHPVRHVCNQPLHEAYSYIYKLAEEASIDRPHIFTKQLLLIIGGCILTANLQGSHSAIAALPSAREAGLALISHHSKTLENLEKELFNSVSSQESDIQLSVNLPSSLQQRLNKLSLDTEKTTTELVQIIIKQALDNLNY